MTMYALHRSPVGQLLLTGNDEGLTGVYPESHRHPPEISAGWRRDQGHFADVREALSEYFSGRLRRFDVRVAATGGEFHRRVWDALAHVPYGSTVSYGELAASIGAPRAARAVGMAVGRNPLSIIVPCHRVVGARGALTGYAAGLDVKRALLALEARSLSPQGAPSLASAPRAG